MPRIYQVIVFLLFCSICTAQNKEERILAKWKPVIEQKVNKLGLTKVDSVYIRTFKLDGTMEVWVSSKNDWRLYSTYTVCVISGIPGRKMIQGDRQVPEGIYKIVAYNPYSSYHLSMKIDYPNKADYYYSDSSRPGDEIYIHGGCASIGCIPITNGMIEEVWTICRLSGDTEIDVHIFSTRFDIPRNILRLETYAYTREDYLFQQQMKKVFFYFEQNRRIPRTSVDSLGNYIIIN